MYKWMATGLLTLIFVLILFSFLDKPDPTVDTIEKYFMDENGLIHAYPVNESSEKMFLSESIGQYMFYLALTENKALFDQQVDILKDYFLFSNGEDNWIKWQYGEEYSTNALVDDFRIIRSLQYAADVFENKDYKVLSNQLLESIRKHQIFNGLVTDFYDWELEKFSDTLHLSYLDVDFLSLLEGMDLRVLEGLLYDPERNSPFFNEVYSLKSELLLPSNDTEVHMVDQLLIALQYVDIFNQKPETFDSWLNEEWETNGKVYGRYDRYSLNRVVDYQSTAVDALSLIYFLKTNEQALAKQVHEKLRQLDEYFQNTQYKGVHVFDYLYMETALELYGKKTDILIAY
ncbi:hypothetical protein SAMN04487944_101570 [Gracilibacillus ureilyticus]|uniref:Glycosyl hydrolases family 8 n=1 Tax=Gracilibacillus ureilyticus TaxID=531814 RepID=A0A1H9M6F3_9BACI|nr:hypothetical protein [Gracilibacillus ureilyticus]SER19055.1 hypothetical protein SAMN04487944_101570 [Gracilibacillus ureilyticus]